MSLLLSRTEALIGPGVLQPSPHRAADPEIASALEADVSQAVSRVFHFAQAEASPGRPSGEPYYLYPHEVYLTPVTRRQEVREDETFRVLGKHISRLGLEFLHEDLLPYRHMIVSLRDPEGAWLGLLLELSWCRFVRRDLYENGGRFLRIVESPLHRQNGEREA
jgi:hypothetical protein